MTLFAQLWQESVRPSTDLRRIAALERRDLGYRKLAEHVNFTGLRPVQVLALRECYQSNGLFAAMRVGSGKTLVSLLSATVLKSTNWLLIVPAKLRDKTLVELPELRKQWSIPRDVIIITYEALGRINGTDVLAQLQPDLLVLDECHKVKNRKAAVTRRIARYLKAFPETRVVALSGTITKRSLLDYAHILRWCLKDRAPVPFDAHELEMWAMSLDEHRGDDLRVVLPGALLELCNEEERTWVDARDAARSAFRRRLVDTPGVVTTQDRGCAASLVVTKLPPPEGRLDDAFRVLRGRWETPNGQPLLDPMAVQRVARQLAMGFYYTWDPAPPYAWIEARRVWQAFVRRVLGRSRFLDTELQVRRQYAESIECRTWLAVKDSFKPNPAPRWLCDSVVTMAAKWLHEEPGICWTEHVCVGETVAQLAGVPYYGAGGAHITGSSSIVCSIPSNDEGRNLQAWGRNLVLSPPMNGKAWEQLLGRTHRDGQERDEVTCDVAAFCAEHLQAWANSVADARYVRDTTGAEQKLLMVDTTNEVSGTGPRWE